MTSFEEIILEENPWYRGVFDLYFQGQLKINSIF